MEVGEVTEFIKKILGKSEALHYCEHFTGISDEKFKSYSFEDLERVLPLTKEGARAAAGIKGQIKLALLMDEIEAKQRAGESISSFFQPTEIEGQATGADGISVEIVPQKSTEVELVTLDSDEEVDQPQDNPKSCISSDEDNSDSEYLSPNELSESDESDGYVPPLPKRRRQIGLASKTGKAVRASKAKRQPVLNVGSSRRTTFTCEEPKIGPRNHRWYDETHGQHCTTINAYQWCWKPLNHRCKYNLFRILCNSPNVKRLNIFNYATDTPADIDLPEGSLLKLKKLSVHRRRQKFGNLLRIILNVAINLKSFKYHFAVEAEEDLRLLVDIDWSELQRLSVFSLSSPSYMTKAHIENLLQVRAPKLRKLEMGRGLFEDVTGDLLENVLKNFPTLQIFRIPGQYYSHTDAHPAVTINFPKLRQLRRLSLGQNYFFAAVGTDDENDQSSALNHESPKAKPFHVTIKFCRILSKLKALDLGNMYHIGSLHLKCFPKLEWFYVGSPWHLSVVFPEKNTRNHSYPLITRLQLPDGLNDSSFLRNIPEHFPNVKKCRLRLPSAHVLRTFFNVMKDVGLKKLHLTTRFDFSSTLESCFLDKVLPIKNSSEDWKRVTELEKCEKWDELVDQHNIILPLRNDEEVQAFVEATGEYGLGAMKQLDTLYLWHLPRILRLPLRENNEVATTSTVKLGYKQYPISTECCEVVRLTSKKFWWDLKEPAGGRERWREASHWKSPYDSSCDEDFDEIEAVPAIQSKLKEEKEDE